MNTFRSFLLVSTETSFIYGFLAEPRLNDTFSTPANLKRGRISLGLISS
jgi:hypothetical protein